MERWTTEVAYIARWVHQLMTFSQDVMFEDMENIPHIDIQTPEAKKLLEKAERLLFYSKRKNLNQIEKLLSRSGDKTQELCMADILTKQAWLKNIPVTDPEYSLYAPIAANHGIPLLEAVKKQGMDVLQAMIKYGLDINCRRSTRATSVLAMAVQCKLPVMIHWLVRRNADLSASDALKNTPLHLAIELGHRDCIEALLEVGAAVNVKNAVGETPLIMVLRQQTDCAVELVRLLLDKGADVNSEDLQTQETPLHFLLQNWNKFCGMQILKLLLEKGADPNKWGPRDQTAVHLTAGDIQPIGSTLGQPQRCKILSLLLKYKARVNVVDHDYNTPLHLAAGNNYAKVAEILLQEGIDPLPRNIDGKRAVDMTKASSWSRVIIQEAMDNQKISGIPRCNVADASVGTDPVDTFDFGELKSKLESLESIIGSVENKLMAFMQERDEVKRAQCSCSVHNNQVSQVDLSKDLSEVKCLVAEMKIDIESDSSGMDNERNEDLMCLYKAFRIVSSLIGHEWKCLFRELEVGNPFSSEVMIREFESQHPGQLREQSYQSLMKWQEVKGHDATCQVLATALTECSLLHILHTLQKKIPKFRSVSKRTVTQV